MLVLNYGILQTILGLKIFLFKHVSSVNLVIQRFKLHLVISKHYIYLFYW